MKTITVTLTDEEVSELSGVLAKLYTWVNYGAGVDAWLGEPGEEILLDPDDQPANEGLYKIIQAIDPTAIGSMEVHWAGIREDNGTATNEDKALLADLRARG